MDPKDDLGGEIGSRKEGGRRHRLPKDPGRRKIWGGERWRRRQTGNNTNPRVIEATHSVPRRESGPVGVYRCVFHAFLLVTPIVTFEVRVTLMKDPAVDGVLRTLGNQTRLTLTAVGPRVSLTKHPFLL